MLTLRTALACTALAAASLAAQAHTAVYTATLSGSNESPANASPGTGSVKVTIDFDLITMQVEASFSGLSGNTTASHIHCCAAPGSNALVATQTPSFVGFPLGVTSGSFNMTYDMTLASSYRAAFITDNGGTVATAFNALVSGLDAGKAYFNIHTSAFPGGELRGNLAPVPEPATYALMLGGLAVLGAVARRQRRS